MNNLEVDVVISKEEKANIINKLIENEKCMQNGERKFSELEMNAILDWTISKYV